VHQEQTSKENIEQDMSLIFPKLQEMCHKIGREKGERIKFTRNGQLSLIHTFCAYENIKME
jgi:hypothetical protein